MHSCWPTRKRTVGDAGRQLWEQGTGCPFSYKVLRRIPDIPAHGCLFCFVFPSQHSLLEKRLTFPEDPLRLWKKLSRALPPFATRGGVARAPRPPPLQTLVRVQRSRRHLARCCLQFL